MKFFVAFILFRQFVFFSLLVSLIILIFAIQLCIYMIQKRFSAITNGCNFNFNVRVAMHRSLSFFAEQ